MRVQPGESGSLVETIMIGGGGGDIHGYLPQAESAADTGRCLVRCTAIVQNFQVTERSCDGRGNSRQNWIVIAITYEFVVSCSPAAKSPAGSRGVYSDDAVEVDDTALVGKNIVSFRAKLALKSAS